MISVSPLSLAQPEETGGFPPLTALPLPPQRSNDDNDGNGDDKDDHDGDDSSHHQHSVETVTVTTSDGDSSTPGAATTSIISSSISQDVSISTVTTHTSYTGPYLTGPTDATSEAAENPIQTADPILESKAQGSGIKTAGIILASVFGMVALLTILYLIFRRRVIRRTRQRAQTSTSRSSSDENSLEKGVIAIERNSRSQQQENGIVYPTQTKSWHSLLGRTWYSTGSLPTATSNRDTHLTNSVSNSHTPEQSRNTILGLGIRRLTPILTKRQEQNNAGPVLTQSRPSSHISTISSTGSHNTSILNLYANHSQSALSTHSCSAADPEPAPSVAPVPPSAYLKPPPTGLKRSGSGVARMLAHHDFTPATPTRVNAGLGRVHGHNSKGKRDSAGSGPGPTERGSMVSV